MFNLSIWDCCDDYTLLRLVISALFYLYNFLGAREGMGCDSSIPAMALSNALNGGD
jgi:hypothetical protein